MLRVTIPLCVIILSLLFSFWLLPLEYIDPSNVNWVFTHLPHLSDAAGHAIQAMFFGQEPWHWPPGRLDTFGGPYGASLIMGAVSPVLAFPAKILETFGLIGPFWQFIGIQGVLGICLTALSVYFLGRALGASQIASGAAAILCLPLPGLFVLAAFNESLSWQFLAVIPMILLLNDKEPLQPAWRWYVLMALAVWGNTYFVPMILAYFAAHLAVSRARHGASSSALARQAGILGVIIVVLHYLGGGFLVSVADMRTSIAWMDTLSVDLADLFHPMYDRQGYVYRGLTVMVLLLAWLCWDLALRVKRRGVAAQSEAANPSPTDDYVVSSKRVLVPVWRYRIELLLRVTRPAEHGEPGQRAASTLIPVALIAVAFFLWSLGPTIHFGKAGSFQLPLPQPVLQAMSAFRAVGRFSWPLMYLVLGLAALAIDALVAKIPAGVRVRRAILAGCCLVLMTLQFVEMYPELRRYNDVVSAEAGQVLSPNPGLDAAVAQSAEVEFVPPAADGGRAALPLLAYYALKHKAPIYSYHWLARSNHSEAARMEKLGIKRAVGCLWTTDHVYAMSREYLPRTEHCEYEPEVLATYPDWVVLKPRQSGNGRAYRAPLEVSSLMPSSGTGGTQVFRFEYYDRKGVADIVTAQALFNDILKGPGGCDVQVDRARGFVNLLSDGAMAWSPALRLGAAGSVQNAQCTISGPGSSVTASGNTLVVKLAINFHSGFRGKKLVYANVVAADGSVSGWEELGTWSVPGR